MPAPSNRQRFKKQHATELGQYFIMRNAMKWAYAPDGNLIIQVPNDGSAVIESYYPAFEDAAVSPTYEARHGAYLNLPCDTWMTPSSPQIELHKYKVKLPLRVRPGDAFIFSRGADSTPIARPFYFGVDGSSPVAEMTCAVFVSWDPTVPGMSPFRPPAVGNGPYTAAMRSQPIWSTAQIDTTLLPSVIDLSLLTPSAVPPLSYLENIFKDFHGPVDGGWGEHQSSPALQNPGYGRNFAGVVSQALCYLCSTEARSTKDVLAARMVQWGIDIAGCFADGRDWQVNGGHMQGRKALVMLAGFLLDWAPFKNPEAFKPASELFQATDCVYRATPSAWWHATPWPIGWEYNSSEGDAGRFLHKPPSQWTGVDATDYGSEKWKFQGYYWHTMGCNLGSALAMHLMGMAAEFGDIVAACAQYMAGYPAAAITDLQNAGISDVTTGESYAIDYNDFCKECWENHYSA